MKSLIFLALLGIFQHSFGQDLADSSIVNLAEFNCQCQDTLSLDQSSETLILQFQDCWTKSMVVSLNKGELTPEMMADETKMREIQNRVFNALAACEKTVQIVQKLNDIPQPQDTVPQELFISAEFFNKHGLKKGEVQKLFNVWNSDGTENIQRVVDIRWVFETHEDALKYHRAKLGENSENGQKIELEIALEGAEELHVFKESKQMERMIKNMDLPQRQHYFLFVVDHVVFKVFAGTDKTLTPEAIAFIPKEAIRIMKEYKP